MRFSDQAIYARMRSARVGEFGVLSRLECGGPGNGPLWLKLGVSGLLSAAGLCARLEHKAHNLLAAMKRSEC